MKDGKPEIFTRPPWDRLLHIHERIQSGRFPNCHQLARELEVALRTVKRDVGFLKDRWHLPIKYHPDKNGYYYTKPVEKFGSQRMSEAELFALLVAHKAVAQYHGTPFQKPLQMAFRKLMGQLDTKTRYTLENMGGALSFRPFAPEDTDLEVFQVLSRAQHQRRVVKFQYKNLGAKSYLKRQVQPYHLACIDNLWYLFAFDLTRQAMRTFVLTRLKEAELTEERFKMPKAFDPDEYLKGSLGVFKGDHDFEVVIDFDEWATDLLRGRQWHHSQEITELPSGRASMKLRLNNLEELERWVLSWGVHATVVRPKALVERIRKVAAELVGRYGGEGKD